MECHIRTNKQCIGNMLRIVKESAIDSVIETVERNLNRTYHRILKCTLEKMVFGYFSINPLHKVQRIDAPEVLVSIEIAAKRPSDHMTSLEDPAPTFA